MGNFIKKLIAVLSYLVLPVLCYEQAVFVAAALLQAVSLMSGNRFLLDNLPLLNTGAAALFSGLILGLVYLHLKKKQGPPSVKCPVSPCRYLYAALFGIFGAVFFNLLLEFSRLPELFPAVKTLENTAPEVNYVLTFLIICLLGPAIEELVFRGFGYLYLRTSLSLPAATLLSAAAFGIFHGNIPQTLYGFCMGLLLAHTAEHYKTLSSVLLFHICANLTSFFFLGDLARESLLLSLPVLGLSGIGCVWLFYKIRDL